MKEQSPGIVYKSPVKSYSHLAFHVIDFGPGKRRANKPQVLKPTKVNGLAKSVKLSNDSMMDHVSSLLLVTGCP